MLRKGQAFARKEHVDGMHFARANVMALPFADAMFDGCLLSGALHIFPDPSGALAEVGGGYCSCPAKAKG